MPRTSFPQSSPLPAYPRWSETLREHSYVRIRPLNGRDDPVEHEFLEQRCPRASHFRLLGVADYPRRRVVDQPGSIAYVNEVAFVAVTPEDHRERIVGVSRYRTDREGLHCECEVTVNDAWQDKGLAVLLMKHLIEVARAQGIRQMRSIDPAADMPMKQLANDLGFRTRMDPDDVRQVVHELDL